MLVCIKGKRLAHAVLAQSKQLLLLSVGLGEYVLHKLGHALIRARARLKVRHAKALGQQARCLRVHLPLLHQVNLVADEDDG